MSFNSYYQPTELIFGRGRVQELGQVARRLGGWAAMNMNGFIENSLLPAHRRLAVAAAVALVLLLVGLPAAAQVVTTGTLSGVVRDPVGAAVPNARVELRDNATGLKSEMQTDEAGGFSFPTLSAGTYSVTVTREGFAVTVIQSAQVDGGRMTNVNPVLTLGQVQQRVEVTGEAPELQTTSVTVATTVSTKEIQELPLAGRDVMLFAFLTPGYASPNGGQNGTYNNLPGAAMNFAIDGANDNYQRWKSGGTSFAYYPVIARLENVQEVNVSTAVLDPASAGGTMQVQFISKRGGEQFHTEIFEQYRNSALNGNTWTNNAQRLIRRRSIYNDFGGNVAGPIWKQHVFFWAGWSEIVQPVSTYGTASVPTSEAQAGVFRYVGTDGVTRTVNVLQLSGGSGFQSTISPTIQAQLNKINPSLSLGTLVPSTNLYSNTLNYALSGRNLNRYPAARIDWVVNNRLHVNLGGTVDWARTYDLQPPFPGPEFQDMRTLNEAPHFGLSLGVDYTFSPKMVTEFTVGYQNSEGNGSPGQNPPNSARIINWPLGLKSGMTIPEDHPGGNPVKTLTDNTHYRLGTHSLHFGATYMADDAWNHLAAGGYLTYTIGMASTDPVAALFTNSAFPAISASSLTNAENLYALLTGRITKISTSLNYDPNTGKYAPYIQRFADYRQLTGGIFVGDSWRVKPQLTVTLGLRWDAFGPWFDNTHTMLGSTYADIWGPSGVGNLFKPGTLTGDPNPVINPVSQFYNTSWKNFSPSGGVAWNPAGKGFMGKLLGDHKTVIRAGFSRNYFSIGSYTMESLMGSTGLSSSASTSPGLPGFVAGQVTLDTPTPPISYTTARVTPLQITSYAFGSAPLADAVKPNIATPYVQSWSVGVQRELKSNVVEARYVGNRGSDLWRSWKYLNEVNIFENGFLQDFVNAQSNLAINSANGVTSFANLGYAGDKALPIFQSAFGALGSNPALTTAQGFGNGTFITQLRTGQAGGLASSLAGTATTFCRIVGSNSLQCGAAGYTVPGLYPVNLFQVNPYTSANTVNDDGFSSYDALQVQFRRRFSQGLSMAANYTWSKSLTNKNEGDIQDAATIRTLRNPNLDKHLSEFDIPQVFTFYGTYDLPFGRGKRYLTGRSIPERIVGSWTLGWILKRQSGVPFLLTGGTETVNDQAGESGVVLNGITKAQLQNDAGVYRTGKPFFYFLNPSLLNPNGSAAAIGPANIPGVFGDFIYIFGPKYFDTDLALTRSFSFSERLKGNLQAQFVNVFNHPNFLTSGGDMNVQDTTFGQSTNVTSPRTIQFRFNLRF